MIVAAQASRFEAMIVAAQASRFQAMIAPLRRAGSRR